MLKGVYNNLKKPNMDLQLFRGQRGHGYYTIEETYLHLKILLPNGWRARVHCIGFKALEKITEHYWWQKAF